MGAVDRMGTHSSSPTITSLEGKGAGNEYSGGHRNRVPSRAVVGYLRRKYLVIDLPWHLEKYSSRMYRSHAAAFPFSFLILSTSSRVLQGRLVQTHDIPPES